MKIAQNELIDKLIQQVQENLATTSTFLNLSTEELNTRLSADSWSILECMAHLNLYGDYYIEKINTDLISNSKPKKKDIYKGGWLGNYFTNLMAPVNKKIKNKMPSPKDKNTLGKKLDKNTLEIRIDQQLRIITLLENARNSDLEGMRVPITISKMIKLKLGDTFRFVIAHEHRHTLQSLNIIHALEVY
ncbi:DinB family protein [Flammeovirga pectinis]|uniref:DinB family protein n=1 Tax=Flammeovirga pectinis TaxID=2494373 RepID=A0A3S9P0J8_9BACT|nr:DinB family protein [Flammeovirga pectinis]AZQ61702.1 DinB family protein [Flammeovirga pectinis]